jgi:hypothetical protein
MCFDRDSGVLAICGGMFENSLCLDFHLYVTPIDKWIQVTSDTGEGCLYANLLCFNGRICAFGGLKSKKEFHHEVRGFDFEKNKWEPLPCLSEEQPAPRFNSSLTAVGPNHWVLFGGRGEDGALLDDLWYLEITEESEVLWEKIDQLEKEPETERRRRSESLHTRRRSPTPPLLPQHRRSALPVPREGHAMVCLDDRLVLIGGHSDSSSDAIPDGCVEILDLETNEWAQMPTNGQSPEGGCLIGGAAHRLGDTMKILVIGGSPGTSLPGLPVTESLCSDLFCPVYLLDLSTPPPYQWRLLPLSWQGPDMTMPPESRCFFSSCFDSQSRCLYLHGGLNLHGLEQTGLCLLDCSELLPPTEGEEEEGRAEGKGEEGKREAEGGTLEIDEDEDEEEWERRQERPRRYADSHFYEEFLELIKPPPPQPAQPSPNQRVLRSVAPLPL